MGKDTKEVVTGLYKTRGAAAAAVDRLVQDGYHSDDISVLMSDRTKTKEFAIETGTEATKGAGIGGAVGGTVGATLAGIAAIGTSLAIPGLGLVIAGPVAAALAGAGAGAATGGLVGMLVGAGIPEHHAKVYDTGLREGGILVGVEPKMNEDTKRLEQLMKESGAEGVRTEK